MLYFFAALGLFILADLARGYFGAQDKKGYLIKSLLGIATVFTLLLLFGPLIALSPVKIGYYSLKDQNLELFYPAGKIDPGQELFEQARKARDINESFYKTSFYTPIMVGRSSLDMLRLGSQPNAGGTGNELAINIRVDKASFNIIAHEMSHRYLAQVVGQSAPVFPRWFDEGLASYLGKMDYYKKTQDLQEDLKEGRFNEDLIQMQGLKGLLKWQWMVFRGGNLGQLYGQSYLMVKYLFDKYGEDKIYQLVMLLKNSGFDKAFLQTFGVTQKQFHQDFLKYIE